MVKPGSRVAISDMVRDEPVPAAVKADPELAGAFPGQRFLQSLADAGFAAVQVDQWVSEPWRVIRGIEFRAVTVTAVKSCGKAGADRGYGVISRGPFAEIRDEEGHVFLRGERMAACERAFRFSTEGPHHSDFIGIEPQTLGEPKTWCVSPGTCRPAAETKGGKQIADCGDGICCC